AVDHDHDHDRDNDGDGGERVLAAGSLEECEAHLLDELERRHGAGRVNVPLRTLGGVQFWGDVFWHADWRIQENAFTGHCRLLDPGDVRRAWGTYAACRVAFEQARARAEITPPGERLAVLLHGMGRSRDSFAAMKRALAADGFAVAALSYP